MSSRLTIEELRKAEAIYTESSDNYHWENARIYQECLAKDVARVAAGGPVTPNAYLQLDLLYRRHGGLGSDMLPAFIIALDELEEAQRLLKLAKKALKDAEWEVAEVQKWAAIQAKMIADAESLLKTIEEGTDA